MPGLENAMTFWQAIQKGNEYSRDTQISQHQHVRFETALQLACDVFAMVDQPPPGQTVLDVLLREASSLQRTACTLYNLGNTSDPAAPGGAVNFYQAKAVGRRGRLEKGIWENKGYDLIWDPAGPRNAFEWSEIYHDHLTPGQLAQKAVDVLPATVLQAIKWCDQFDLTYQQRKRDPEHPEVNMGPIVLIRFLIFGSIPSPYLEYDVATDTMTYKPAGPVLLSLPSNSSMANFTHA